MSDQYRIKTPCGTCPWRKDVPVGHFPPERFIRLQNTVEQTFAPVFACHNSKEDRDIACAGFLMVEGDQNFTVRMAASAKRFLPNELSSPYPLFDSYAEMALANGVKKRQLRPDVLERLKDVAALQKQEAKLKKQAK